MKCLDWVCNGKVSVLLKQGKNKKLVKTPFQYFNIISWNEEYVFLL